MNKHLKKKRICDKIYMLVGLASVTFIVAGVVLSVSGRILPQSESITSEYAAENNLININTASKEELQKLPGVGKTLADRILEYRKTHGGFSSKEELDNVRGIGSATLEKILPMACV